MKFKHTNISSQKAFILTPKKVPIALRAMQKRQTWDGVSISPKAKLGPDGKGQYPILSLAWYPDYGYEVHCIELSSESHFLVTNAKLSRPKVYIELGGQGQELWPRELFVPYEVAKQAILYLLTTGKRDPSLAWVGISTFPRKAVRARKHVSGK